MLVSYLYKYTKKVDNEDSEIKNLQYAYNCIISPCFVYSHQSITDKLNLKFENEKSKTSSNNKSNG